ncbi:T9SS type A sorting domain-containing protein, partial [bacterium]|nr:T9SS type A sorting domain-containing protein [bacterium]
NAGPFTDSFAIITGPPLPAGGPLVLESVIVDDSQPSAAASVRGTKAARNTAEIHPWHARITQSQKTVADSEGLREGARQIRFNLQINNSIAAQDSGSGLRPSGNGDGILNGGEIVDLYPIIRNDGNEAFAIGTSLQSNSPHAVILDGYSWINQISAGETVTLQDPWTIGLKLDTRENLVLEFTVSIWQLVGETFSGAFAQTAGPPLPQPPPALPGVLYGSGGQLENGRLFSIDPITGAGTAIGRTGFYYVHGLAANASGEIFASGNGWVLSRIHPATGAALFAGRFFDEANGQYLYSVGALAFDANDILYAIDASTGSPNLYRVDPMSGAATLIGSTGVPSLMGLSFHPINNVLYAAQGRDAEGIYTIDLNTASATLVGTTGLQSSMPDIAFGATGTLFGVTGRQGPNARRLITIDPLTAQGSVVGPLGLQSVAGLTFAKPPKHACVTYDFPLAGGGWYLVSLPIVPSDASREALFPQSVAAFKWDFASSSYLATEELQPEQAYWLLMLEAATVEVCGEAIYRYSRNYTAAGWDLLGAVMNPSAVTAQPADGIIALYGWDPAAQNYLPVDPHIVEPRQGYWAFVYNVPCSVTVGGALASGEAKGKGQGANVRAGAELEAFYAKYGTMPPPPPYELAGNTFAPIPEQYGLSQDYPNPFNPETTIEYQVPQAGRVSLKVYNLLGHEIRTLVDQDMPAGYHRVKWDGRSESGQKLESGVYLYRLRAGEFAETRKTLLLK